MEGFAVIQGYCSIEYYGLIIGKLQYDYKKNNVIFMIILHEYKDS